VSCFCDVAGCKVSWICRQLGELRIAHRVVSALKNDEKLQCRTTQELLDQIEFECEVLCK
jgi:hypothetical protein